MFAFRKRLSERKKRSGLRTWAALFVGFFVLVSIILLSTGSASAQQNPQLPINPEDFTGDSSIVQLLVLITIIALAPSIIIMVTSFTRIIIVLSFIRNAIGTAQMPPNQVLVGTALFISLFVMSPVINDINEQAIQPYSDGAITQQQAFENGLGPIRDFMFRQTDERDLALFVSLSQDEKPQNRDEVSTLTLVPAFIISEMKKAFMIAFFIYIPFLIIDIVVAGTLMSMGMMMLPPIMISLPFKLLLFVMVDGWHIITRSLISGFN